MKAIVLTYDKYKIFADHMIHTYMALWPDNPFIFMIPYQNEDIKSYYEKKYGSKVEMIKSPSDIVGTMETLLNLFNDEEWVYWCMDDRYLIRLNIPEIEKTYKWILPLKDSSIGAVKCISHLVGDLPKNINYKSVIENDYGQIFYERKNYLMIWIHQFLRVKVLKDLFFHIPRDLKAAKEMDYIIDNLKLPSTYKLYSSHTSLMILGESTNRGKITKNCYESLRINGFEIPEGFEVLNKIVISGGKPSIKEKILFYSKKRIRNLLEKIGFREFFRQRDIKSEKIKS